MSLEEVSIAQADLDQLQAYYDAGVTALANNNPTLANDNFKLYHQYKATLGSEVGEFGYQIRNGSGPLAEFTKTYVMTYAPEMTEAVFDGDLAAHFIKADLDWIKQVPIGEITGGNLGGGNYKLPTMKQFIENEIAAFPNFVIPGTNIHLEQWHHPGYFYTGYFEDSYLPAPLNTSIDGINRLIQLPSFNAYYGFVKSNITASYEAMTDGYGVLATYYVLGYEFREDGAIINGDGEIVNYQPNVRIWDKMLTSAYMGAIKYFEFTYNTGLALESALGLEASPSFQSLILGRDEAGDIVSVFAKVDGEYASLESLKVALFGEDTIASEFALNKPVHFFIDNTTNDGWYEFTANPHDVWGQGIDIGWDNNGISLELGPGFQDFLESFNRAFTDPIIFVKGDPLVVDLDGDGYDLIAPNQSNVYFDFNGDAIGERTGWVGPDDGLLALDANNNGLIDGLSELFGDLTQTGFEELATHDETVNGGNGDGVINASDSVFADLRIWQDLNSNGVTDAGELQSLSAWGIQQISFTPTPVDQMINGNYVLEESTFADGTAVDKKIGEVFFNIDYFDNEMVSGAGTVFGTDEELLALPLSRGYGEVVSLQKAMETDLTLRGLVENLADYTVTSSSAATLKSMVNGIILRWTGADSVTPDPYALFDVQKLAAMEALTGLDSDDLLNGSPMTANDATRLTGAWEQLHDLISTRLLFQGPLKNLTPNAHYDFINDNMNLNASLGQIFTAMNQSGWNSVGMSEYLYDLLNVNGNIDPNVPVPNEAYSLFADFDTAWYFTAPPSHLTRISGTASADTLGGSGKGDAVFAGAGNDTITTPSSSNVVHTINGIPVTTTYYSADSHHYIYGQDGNDSITAAYGWVHLFGGDGNDTISTGSNTKNATIHGGDGADRITTGSGNDLLFGGLGNDSINGGTGNDKIYGGTGDDTLIGGGGNDLIEGGAGNDSITASNGIVYIDDQLGDNIFILSGVEATLLAGAGNDTVSISGAIGVSEVSLGDGLNVVTRSGSTSPTGSLKIISGADADNIAIFAANSTIESGEGNDTITTGNGDDSIVGGGGADSINADSGNNTVYGGDGNDWIQAHGTASLIDGGDGNDTINATADTNVVTGGNGNDSIFTTKFFTIDAGAGDDTVSISGSITNGNSSVDLGAGKNALTVTGLSSSWAFNANANMIITTGDEGDSVVYNRSKATVIGGLGDDTITTGTGDDSITAGDGNDIISVSSGNNTVYGGAGNDSISASNGNDLLEGGDGADTIISGSGADTIYGGNGNDSITTSGLLTIDAGAGDDTVSIDGSISNGNSSVDLGSGKNALTVIGLSSSWVFNANANMSITTGDEGDSVVYNRSKATVTGGLGNDTITTGTGDDSITASDGNDIISVSSGNNTVYGGAGNDSITAGNGNDLLEGGDGADTIVGGGGTDTIYGGNGNDSITASGLLTIDAGAGDDTVTINSAVLAGAGSIDLGTGKNVLAQTGSVTLLATASMTITTGDEGDSITYGRSKATVIGGLGDDTITTGTGDDSITAGDGNDIINVSSGNNTVYSGAGNDAITASNGNDLLDGGDGADTIVGGGGTDTLYGGNGNDSITASTGNDLIYGGDGSDSINAGNGANTVYGGDGNDLITTGTGSDIIYGGAGTDSMTGGSGVDYFVFTDLTHSTDTARDIITDFVHNTDKIDLTGLGFTGIASGTGSGATLGFSVVGGNTIIVDDDSDFSIQLTGNIALTASDFIFS